MRSIALLILFAACTDEVPAHPTFQSDIAPILNARCVRCHGYPQLSAPHDNFRLDMFDSRDVAGSVTPAMLGVKEQATTIRDRITGFDADNVTIATMPPRFPLTDVQIDTMIRWIDQGAERGPPRPGNHRPELVFEVEMIDGVTTIDYELTDLDDDLVTGVVIAKSALISGSPVLELYSGRGVKLGLEYGLPSGPYELEARIDDGSGVMTEPLGYLVIP